MEAAVYLEQPAVLGPMASRLRRPATRSHWKPASTMPFSREIVQHFTIDATRNFMLTFCWLFGLVQVSTEVGVRKGLQEGGAH